MPLAREPPIAVDYKGLERTLRLMLVTRMKLRHRFDVRVKLSLQVLLHKQFLPPQCLFRMCCSC